MNNFQQRARIYNNLSKVNEVTHRRFGPYLALYVDEVISVFDHEDKQARLHVLMSADQLTTTTQTCSIVAL